MENNKPKSILYVVGKILYYVVVAFICLIALFLLYYIISSQMNADNEDYKPKFSIYTIVSPSMTPTIKVYDVVINIGEDNPSNIKVGDIITYISKASTSEGMTITHRVTEVTRTPDGGYEYRTQGDNNSEPDRLYVSFDQVIGKEIVIIPYLGRIQFLIANQKGWLFLLLIPVSIYTLLEIYKLINLFGIKSKVREVVNDTEQEELAKEQEEYENARKEKIREELRIKNANMNPVPLPTTREEIAKYKEDAVEVLDTDPLTTKIKEYDDRINQLGNVLDRMSRELPEEEKEEPVEENYLTGGRIKVTNMEDAKKKRFGVNDHGHDNRIIDLDFEEEADNNELEDIIPLENDRSIIERPHSVDIGKPVIEPRNNENNKSLNLNPRNVKKIRRPNRSNNNNRNRNRNLNLNPNNVKRVSRNRPNNRPNNRPKPKKKLIVIEKK